MTYPRPHSYQAAELGWAPRQKTAEFQSLLVGGAAPHPYQPNSFGLPGSSNRPRGEKHEESWALGLSPGPNAGLLSDFAKSHALSLAFSFLMCKMRVWFFFLVWIMEVAEHPMTAAITRVRYSGLQPPRYHSPAVWRPVRACPLWASVSLAQTQGWQYGPHDSATGLKRITQALAAL